MIVTEITVKDKPSKDKQLFIDYRFKIIYAIAMLSVIADHCRGKGSIEFNIQGWFPYSSYHMPLFMFAAGYFYKRKNVESTCNYIIRKFKRLILRIYIYNFFYGLFIQKLKKKGFRNKNIIPFSFEILFIKPLGGRGFKYISPSWFSSSLFFVEVYNILKRKLISFFKIELHESIYFLIDLYISYKAVILSNLGYSNREINKNILRFMHLNIYFEFAIFFNKHLEKLVKKIRNDIFIVNIFILKLCFHLYYSAGPIFYYGANNYYNYPPFTVIIVSFSGIAFWYKISEILESLLGKNYYINIIANNTFSIMINHLLALDLVRTFFAIISKNTKYCKDFNFNKYYSFEDAYIYIPNNILQSGVVYFLSCLILPIIMQKIINIIQKSILKIF